MGKVLVVDDDQSIRELLFEVLTEEGHRVVIARDGVEALRVLEREGHFLVLLDLMMPRLDGIGVIHALENRPSTHDENRVVVMSAADRLFAMSSLLQRGIISEQIAKPFDLGMLLDVVARYVPEPA
jgi:CheY-like chemotaxis protein